MRQFWGTSSQQLGDLKETTSTWKWSLPSKKILFWYFWVPRHLYPDFRYFSCPGISIPRDGHWVSNRHLRLLTLETWNPSDFMTNPMTAPMIDPKTNPYYRLHYWPQWTFEQYIFDIFKNHHSLLWSFLSLGNPLFSSYFFGSRSITFVHRKQDTFFLKLCLMMIFSFLSCFLLNRLFSRMLNRYWFYFPPNSLKLWLKWLLLHWYLVKK